MKRHLAFSSKICVGLTVTGDKFWGSNNILKKFDEFGTYLGKQVLCQHEQIIDIFLAWYAPFFVKKVIDY